MQTLLCLIYAGYLLAGYTGVLSAQTDKGLPFKHDQGLLVVEQLRKATALIDKGSYPEAIAILAAAKTYDSTNYTIAFETGRAFFLMGKYPEAIQLLAPLSQTPAGASADQCWLLLAEAYQFNQDSALAKATYAQGINLFPSSGKLYLGMGRLLLTQYQQTEAAIDMWESGIMAEPEFSGNYYMLAKVFCETEDRGWGLLYGEAFMNLERDSPRNLEISQLLYKTWDEAIEIQHGSAATFRFFSSFIRASDFKGKTLPFSLLYGTTLTMAGSINLLGGKTEGLSFYTDLIKIADEMWYKKKNHKKYPNTLLSWHHALAEVKYLDFYTHWLLRAGDPDAFAQWLEGQEMRFAEFGAWQNMYARPINNANFFCRKQYVLFIK